MKEKERNDGTLLDDETFEYWFEQVSQNNRYYITNIANGLGWKDKAAEEFLERAMEKDPSVVEASHRFDSFLKRSKRRVIIRIGSSS